MNRTYLKRCALFTSISLAVAGCATTAVPVTATEQLFYGGPILTMSGNSPEYVEALLVKDGKIIFVGSKQQAERLADKKVQ